MKRVIDIVLASVGLLLLALPMAVIALGVRNKLGSPVFFTQLRTGLHGKPFKMIKFRTMTNEYDRDGNLLPEERRLTKFGRWLRSTSLDELPELWNVFRGEMSLVGPRALLVQYLPLYSIVQARRLEVLPGISGWAQINGRNAINWEDKFKLDVWYVENHNTLLDIKILIITTMKVILRDGIGSSDSEIMPAFTGNIKLTQKDNVSKLLET